MRLRTVAADVLPDLPLRKFLDHPRPNGERQYQCRKRRQDRTQREIAEDTEAGDVRFEKLR